MRLVSAMPKHRCSEPYVPIHVYVAINGRLLRNRRKEAAIVDNKPQKLKAADVPSRFHAHVKGR